jgi:hypothetical protein
MNKRAWKSAQMGILAEIGEDRDRQRIGGRRTAQRRRCYERKAAAVASHRTSKQVR